MGNTSYGNNLNNSRLRNEIISHINSLNIDKSEKIKLDMDLKNSILCQYSGRVKITLIANLIYL